MTENETEHNRRKHMGNRYTIKDCRKALAALAAASGVEICDFSQHKDNATGKWVLDHYGLSGGYMVRQYENEGLGYSAPFGNKRLGAKEFVAFCNQIEGGIIQGRRLAAQEAEKAAQEAEKAAQEAQSAHGSVIASQRALQEYRSAAADKAFEAFDFGDTECLEADGWESSTPGNEWTRTFYIESQASDDLNDDDSASTGSQLETFVVRFKPETAEVAEAYVSGW
jgi:hypothetical protein